jgi:hypothetical protein
MRKSGRECAKIGKGLGRKHQFAKEGKIGAQQKK